MNYHQNKQHFSHHHILASLKLEEGEKIKCNGCEELIFEPFHGCLSCHHYLHDHCLAAPRSLQHPSHPHHPLTLLPTPTHSTRSYTCNACGSQGNAFCFSCALCEFDLHLGCASLPNTLLLDDNIKHSHELQLIFDGCSGNNSNSKIFVCDICHGKVDHNYWMYNCADCEFTTHLNCAAANAKASKPVKEEEIMRSQAENSDQLNIGSSSEGGQVDYEAAQRWFREQNRIFGWKLEVVANRATYLGSPYFDDPNSRIHY